MTKLNLPGYPLQIREQGQSKQIFDAIRKKYVALTPEEWVRQHFIHYLISEKKYPIALIAVEASFEFNGLSKRCDILVYDRNFKPWLIVECKAPKVTLDQKVFDQIARYNLKWNVGIFILTNGLQHFCCKMDHEKGEYIFLNEIPVIPLLP